MSEYITKPYEDKGQIGPKYIVCPQEASPGQTSFAIICMNSNEAHKLKLALLLGTTPTPKQAPEVYTYIKKREDIEYYTAKPIAFSATEDVFESDCCQSGCSGCPDYIPPQGE